MEVFACGDEETVQARLQSFVLEMEARSEPYGYAGEATPEPIVLLLEDGQVAVLDPGMEVVLRLGDTFRFDDLDAAVQAEKEAASVILVVSGTVEVTHHGSELARLAAGQGILWRGEELEHLTALGGPVVYYQAEGRRLRREHFDGET